MKNNQKLPNILRYQKFFCIYKMYLISAEGYKYARVNLLKVMNYELNPKNNKEVYAENDVMTTVIKRCRGGKKRGEIKIDGFTKKN